VVFFHITACCYLGTCWFLGGRLPAAWFQGLEKSCLNGVPQHGAVNFGTYVLGLWGHVLGYVLQLRLQLPPLLLTMVFSIAQKFFVGDLSTVEHFSPCRLNLLMQTF